MYRKSVIKLKKIKCWVFLNFKIKAFIKKNNAFLSFLSTTCIFLNCTIRSLINYKRSFFWKLEVSSYKNEEDRFLVLLKLSKRVDLKKFSVHTFVSETYRNCNILKVEQGFFLFSKIRLVVCTQRFNIKSNVIFSKINCQTPLCPKQF